MNRPLLQTTGIGVLMGSFLASYISLTAFWQMPYHWWLAMHNSLLVTSLILTAFIAYQHWRAGLSFLAMLITVLFYYFVIMFLYIGSYAVTTGFLADQMAWIPFFYHDYNYHGFPSVAAYLDHNNNFQELLKLQTFSMLMSSVMYVAAGSLGYGTSALFGRMKRAAPPRR